MAQSRQHERDPPLELRQYLDTLKRHKWFILEAVVVAGLVAGILSSLQTPLYKATARVLLIPNDPTQQLNPTGGNGAAGNDPDRYVAGQVNIVESEDVATEAAKTLAGIPTPKIEAALSVSEAGQSNVLKISATEADPAQARDIADAVAKGYIENRRLAAVSGLQAAADDIQQKLGPLQAQIGSLDAQIGDTPADVGATSALVSPVKPGTGSPAGQAAPQVDPGAPPATGAPSSQEALKAARYAAAVQYETLYSRQQELLVDISLKRGDADLIATAKTPGAPISPHPKKDAALGLSIGLLLGVGISIAREQFGDRVRSAQEIERITGLPMLTQLPFDAVSAKDASSLAVVDRPLGSLSESLRSLRTSIQYLGVDRPIKVIVVTSAVPGEGKSLVSANLGAVFAQAGYRTLLISGDLRRSSVERLFAMPEKSDGLTGVLAPFATNAHAAHSGNGASGANGSNGATGANGVHRGGANGSTGQVPIDDAGLVRAVVRTSVPSLRLLPSGPTPPNPAELLGSARMGTVLDGYAGLFDVIVIDTPPLLAVTDAAVLASKADGVVLVTAVNETRRDGLRRAMAVLEGTGGVLLGTVVNKVTKSQGYYNYDSTYYGTYSGDRRRRRRDRTYEGAGAEPPRLRTGTG